jgi:hypothetical protein
MHSETERYQVRDAAGERKPIEILSGGDYGRLKSFTPSRRDVHPNPLRISSDIVPSGPPGFPRGTKPFVSAPTMDLVCPLSLTKELRLCQNIEHYQLST